MRNITLISLIILLAGCHHKEKFDATGTFEATEIIISSEVEGRILSLDINEGDIVNPLQVVGIIDSTQLYLKKLQLLKSVKSVSSDRPDIAKQIAATKEQLANQKTEQRRIQNLIKANAATTKQLDDINSAVIVLERQLDAQLSSLNNRTASLNAQSSSIDVQIAQVDEMLGYCKVKPYVGGTVLDKFAEEGELAVTGKPLFKIADLNKMFLRAYVTSAQLADIKLGDKVRVMAQFGGDRQRDYEGTIYWIASKNEFTPRNIQTVDERAELVYAIKIRVENDGYLKIGGYGEVFFNK